MVLSTISPSPPSSLDPPSPHPIWCNPFRAPSSPLCTPFPISKTVLLIINTYLLFATAHSFYVHRSLKYSKKSWSFTFLILTLFWALLRQLFFALSLSLLTPFPLSLFYLLYWLPSPLQFSSFMILPLFYAELFHVKLTNVYNTGLWIQGAGSTKVSPRQNKAQTASGERTNGARRANERANVRLKTSERTAQDKQTNGKHKRRSPREQTAPPFANTAAPFANTCVWRPNL